jgi:hypothetical protein
MMRAMGWVCGLSLVGLLAACTPRDVAPPDPAPAAQAPAPGSFSVRMNGEFGGAIGYARGR